MITLTPADKGFLAATLDDARSMGLSDDDIAQELVNTILFHSVAEGQSAWDLAYDFLSAE